MHYGGLQRSTTEGEILRQTFVLQVRSCAPTSSVGRCERPVGLMWL